MKKKKFSKGTAEIGEFQTKSISSRKETRRLPPRRMLRPRTASAGSWAVPGWKRQEVGVGALEVVG